ncbi:rhodanese-like domain-containing protein [Propionimicrobium lymphophilum]|uniref:rhodanese-like domain-containing protein n=1 Tax=Propionimicrobium lymphophilum TaxID=33012 RepID=UPI0023F0E3F8|nr:rhodanese-like domain-containing protein [Propionimicrobium lymphophilum]MDK7709643.1 rhodanese-like domain-containing protein [Propionimicrobium lymphophilum]MDK7733628.1 rhodanese-like domain-containing protein [Propionimicrobium lymphophilum]
MLKKESSADELLAMIRSGEAVALDVREDDEREAKDLSVPSEHLPLSRMSERVFDDFLTALGATTKVVIYCASGGRSQRVVNHFSDKAAKAGVELLNLPGGVLKNAGK